jgi:ribosomal protein S18 acetylase RimI-like enzyme
MSKLTFGAKPPVLRCGRCGRFVDWEDSRLQVICGCRPHLPLPPVLVREAAPAERDAALQLFKRDFGPTQLLVHGQPVSLDDAMMLVAETERAIAGALAWRRIDNAVHVLALATDPMWQRAGVGGHLVAEAEALARRLGLTRVTVSITNDNLPALYFYQRRGYRVSAVLADSAAAHTPDEPAIGFAGIPILDELQLVKTL